LGIDPIRRPYDLRHTYATFALRAGISIFDLSRFMGASLAMIDKHYGHLARDGRDHAVACWTPTRTIPPRGRHVDVAAELRRPLGDSGCSLANSLTFGTVDISWTSPLSLGGCSRRPSRLVFLGSMRLRSSSRSAV
jgi:hypothetical protein